MKLFWSLVIILLFCAGFLPAQEASGPVTGRAVWFDVSPPLRNYLQIPPKRADGTWKDGYVPNSADLAGQKSSILAGIDTVIQRNTGRDFPDSVTVIFA